MSKTVMIKDELLDLTTVMNMFYKIKERREVSKDDNKVVEKSYTHNLAVKFTDVSTTLVFDGFDSKEEVLAIIKKCYNIKNGYEKPMRY